MKFRDAIDLATAHAYLVEWIPEDWPNSLDPMKTYVSARSIDEATGRLTTNPRDIKRVTVLGDIIERTNA
jgi:hypothetical protein